MNTFNITLSNNESTYAVTTDTVYLTDLSTLYITLSNIVSKAVIKTVLINWGDGSNIESYSPSISGNANSLIYNITKLTDNTYSHIYYPSTDTLTRSISCTLSALNCRNGLDDNSAAGAYIFKIPINIVAPSFYNKVNDLMLLQSNIIDTDNSVLYTFGTVSNGSIVETIIKPS